MEIFPVFVNIYLFCIFKTLDHDKSQKLSSPKKNTPSSKPYRTEFFLILLQNMTDLQHLVLAGNNISQLDHSSIPHTLRHLHLGRNNITHLNGTLR